MVRILFGLIKVAVIAVLLIYFSACPRTDDQIRAIAYDYLDAQSKSMIQDWASASVQAFHTDVQMPIRTHSGIKRVDGLNCLEVVFVIRRRARETASNEVIVFIDKTTFNVIGMPFIQ